MGSEEASSAPLGLRFQITVGALDVTFGEGIARGAVQAHGPRGSGHAAVNHPRRTGEYQHLVGGSVAAASRPGFAFAVLVGDVSLLHDGIDAAAGMKRRIQRRCWC